MKANDKFRKIDDLSIGDVLLCHSNTDTSIVARVIEGVTGSKYCHAAICYGDGLAAESVTKNGVKKGRINKVEVESLITRYDHIAVIRHFDVWHGKERQKVLREFIDAVVENGACYNFLGVLHFSRKKLKNEESIQERLEEFFSEGGSPYSVFKKRYFCSEFIADCFIAVGYMQPSAIVMYQPDTCAPGDLGQDGSPFGFFWGYLTAKKDYQVDQEDYFYYRTTMDEIFNLEN